MVLVEGALDVIKEVKPDLVLMDPLFHPWNRRVQAVWATIHRVGPNCPGPCIAFNEPLGEGTFAA